MYLATAGWWEEAIAKSMNATEGVMYTFYGGATPKAIEALKRAFEIDPDHSVALYVSGMAFGRTGEHDRAIEALARISEISGRATYYLGILARGFRECGERG